jgi:hypothetical protein
MAEAKIPTHVFSLSEAAVRDVHETQREALLSHNRRYLMRVFPSGLRVTSSNADPSFFWQQGAQMVALNWQRCDKGMMLNEAMFADGPGWAMKPEGLRDGDIDTNDVKSPIVQTVDLTIEIFAGQKLPLPLGNSRSESFRPYVKCRLHVAKIGESMADAANKKNNDSNTKIKLRTKTCSGTDPDFGGEKMAFPSAKEIIQELSFVRLVLAPYLSRLLFHLLCLFPRPWKRIYHFAVETIIPPPILHEPSNTCPRPFFSISLWNLLPRPAELLN